MQISTKFTIAIHLLTAVDFFGETQQVTSEVLAGSIGSNPVIIRGIMLKLRAAGLNMPPLSGFYVGAPDAPALGRVVVNYADLEPEQFTAALRAALPTLRDAKS